ncbi:MAG: PEP-CTERM sorting domain-containing protein [Pseudomonadota bacterium]|nr:PEP-CTERM sorting domain-containing protein [Pseudomonadota bacterium]
MTRLASLLAGATVALCAASAQAAHFVDTGTPNGNPIGAYTLDGTDFLAGQITFGSAARVDAVFAHILDGTAGETFTIALYDDSAVHLPGSLLHTATATFTTDGWNGVSALSGWDVTAGSYWIGLELGFDDSLGQGSLSGALLDRGVPRPLARTAFNAGAGYQASPLDFGLQVDATVAPVPEPETFALLLAGLGVFFPLARRRRN